MNIDRRRRCRVEFVGLPPETEHINQTRAKKRKSIGNKCSIRYRLFTGAILDDSPPSYKISVNIISEDIVSVTAVEFESFHC